MNVNNMTLPYPVLGIKDDVLPLPEFTSEEVAQTDDSYIFDFTAIVENEEIENLINQGKACYVCEVNCQRTFLRKCYKQATPHFIIELSKQDVSNTIEFEVTVTVTQSIDSYENAGFHEDYRGFSFNLDAGDLLAFIAAFTYDADIKYDKLQAVGSFMEIEKASNNSDPVRVSLGGDKILLLLPPTMYSSYRARFSQDKNIACVIHSSIVFNALLQALYCYEENKNTLWARTIRYRLLSEDDLKRFCNENEDEEGLFDKESVFDIAQALLGNPYERLFEVFGGKEPEVDIMLED